MPSQFQLWETTLYQVWRWIGCVTSCSRTWTEWWLNIRRHIKLAPSPQHLKQEKGKSREGVKRKRGSSQLVKTEEKEHALFCVLWEESPLAEDFEPDIFGILRLELIVKPYICLPQRHTKHAGARPLQGKRLRPGRLGDCLELLRVNLQLSYRASKYKWFVWDQLCFYLNLAL